MKKLSTMRRKNCEHAYLPFPFDAHFSRDMMRYCKSFVVRDFKLLAQLAVHLLSPFMDGGEKEVWLKLGQCR